MEELESKNKIRMDEFVITRSKNQKRLNRDIREFRIENPNYEIFNISGAYDSGSTRFFVIWRLKY